MCVWPVTGMWQPKCFPCFLFQVQDIEFTQIEMKVIEGLKIGNECLNKMHQVRVTSQPGEPQLWAAVSLQPRSRLDLGSSLQVMSIEEVERIIGETQDAVEYQRVRPAGGGSCGQRLVLHGACPTLPRETVGLGVNTCREISFPVPLHTLLSREHIPCCSRRAASALCRWLDCVFFSVPQQIDELLAGSLTEEDEDAILEELNAITQVGLTWNCFKSTTSM